MDLEESTLQYWIASRIWRKQKGDIKLTPEMAKKVNTIGNLINLLNDVALWCDSKGQHRLSARTCDLLKRVINGVTHRTKTKHTNNVVLLQKAATATTVTTATTATEAQAPLQANIG